MAQPEIPSRSQEHRGQRKLKRTSGGLVKAQRTVYVNTIPLSDATATLILLRRSLNLSRLTTLTPVHLPLPELFPRPNRHPDNEAAAASPRC
jgi:hypothetical protein